jgi:hypothetical protein
MQAELVEKRMTILGVSVLSMGGHKRSIDMNPAAKEEGKVCQYLGLSRLRQIAVRFRDTFDLVGEVMVQ